MNMKKIISCILFTAVSGIIFTACKKDFLNTKPLGQVSSAVVWTDGALAQAFVNGVYNYSDPSDYTWAAKEGLGVGGFDEQMLASLTDEAVFTHAGRGINTITEGTLNPSNLGWVNRSYDWNIFRSNADWRRKIHSTNRQIIFFTNVYCWNLEGWYNDRRISVLG